MTMDLDGYLAVIATEAARMAAVAQEAGLDAKTPTCPAWNIRKLILHQGEVHRWATAVVAGRYTSFAKLPKDTLGKLPTDAETFDWFRDGVATLIDTLATGDPAVEYDMFLREPQMSRLLLWARRQAMELCIHRVDAESAVGRCTAFPPKVAAEGIDEFLTAFITRGKGAVHRDTPHTIAFVPDDVEDRWTVTISEGPLTTARAHVENSECAVSGPASDMFLALWNRLPTDAMKVEGDTSLLTDLAANVRIRWS